jgi:hypothetical protein
MAVFLDVAPCSLIDIDHPDDGGSKLQLSQYSV